MSAPLVGDPVPEGPEVHGRREVRNEAAPVAQRHRGGVPVEAAGPEARLFSFFPRYLHNAERCVV